MHIRSFDKRIMAEVFGNLTSAHLQYRCNHDEQEASVSDFLNEMIAFAPHLQSINFAMNYEPGSIGREWYPELDVDDPLASFATTLRCDHLRELELTWGRGHEKDLIKLLQRHSQKLRKLGIYAFEIAEEEQWGHVLQFILDNLKLETLALDGLWRVGNVGEQSLNIEGRPSHDLGCKFSGIAEVKKGLQDILAMWARRVVWEID